MSGGLDMNRVRQASKVGAEAGAIAGSMVGGIAAIFGLAPMGPIVAAGGAVLGASVGAGLGAGVGHFAGFGASVIKQAFE